MPRLIEVFQIFLRLGCVSFGGPMAHLGYYHREFVERRRWIDETEYTNLVALCTFLPGPASSQVGMAIGHRRAGVAGSIAAFLGFTTPSAILMIAAALLLTRPDLPQPVTDALHGFKIFAVAVVADAVWKLARKTAPDTERIALAIVAAALILIYPTLVTQLLVIGLGMAFGGLVLRQKVEEVSGDAIPSASGARSLFLLIVFTAGFLAFLPIAELPLLARLADTFYRVGGLVFGGGHVVLPMLETQPLVRDTLTQTEFLTGYSLAQAVPGPMFTLSSYLGTAMTGTPLGGIVATLAIFLPGWLLVIALLPHWQRIRQHPTAAAVMNGAAAATVGLLLAALYDPVWVNAVERPADAAAALLAWLAFSIFRVPVWVMVPAMGVLGVALGMA